MYSIIFKPNRYNSFAWTNIVALLLLLYFGKVEPYTVIFGYFLETLIIGVFNVVKMYIDMVFNPRLENFDISCRSAIPLINEAMISGMAISFSKLIKMVPNGFIQSAINLAMLSYCVSNQNDFGSILLL